MRRLECDTELEHLVHIGFHKTATTWLQHEIYPNVVGAIPTKGDRVLTALLMQLCSNDSFYAEAFRSALFDLGDRAIISFEGLAGAPFGPGNSRTLIIERLAEVVPNARILIVTREETDHRRALHAQYVNEGGILPLDRFDEVLNPGYLNLDEAISCYRDRFMKVKVLAYEQLKAEPTATVDEIARFADVSFPVVSSRRQNISLSHRQLLALRLWNRFCRRSDFNPNPLVPIPYAGAMRHFLQGRGRA